MNDANNEFQVINQNSEDAAAERLALELQTLDTHFNSPYKLALTKWCSASLLVNSKDPNWDADAALLEVTKAVGRILPIALAEIVAEHGVESPTLPNTPEDWKAAIMSKVVPYMKENPIPGTVEFNKSRKNAFRTVVGAYTKDPVFDLDVVAQAYITSESKSRTDEAEQQPAPTPASEDAAPQQQQEGVYLATQNRVVPSPVFEAEVETLNRNSQEAHKLPTNIRRTVTETSQAPVTPAKHPEESRTYSKEAEAGWKALLPKIKLGAAPETVEEKSAIFVKDSLTSLSAMVMNC